VGRACWCCRMLGMWLSARVLEELGYPAIATTSAGVAFALGYPDGQRVTRDEMLEVVARMRARCAFP